MSITPRIFSLIVIGLGLTFFAVVVAGLEGTDGGIAKPSLTPADIPDVATKLKNPFVGNAESMAHGKLIFSSQCVMCHGKDGRGTGDLVERLELEIPDFVDAEMQAKWTDGALFYVINQGHGEMPGQKDRFDEETKWGLVNYVRTFSHAD